MNADPFKDVRERRASAGATVLAYPGRPLEDIDRLLTENERLREALEWTRRFCEWAPEGQEPLTKRHTGFVHIVRRLDAALAAPSTEPK
jgi:hypothetical protein